MPVESFFCRRCANPIRIDDSLLRLNTVQVKLLGEKRHRASQHDDDDDELDPTQFISPERLEVFNEANREQQKPKIFHDDIDVDEQDTGHVAVSTSLASNSFVMLSDGDNGSVNDADSSAKAEQFNGNGDGSISSRLKTLAHIFEVLSNNNEIDHPLCQDCSNLLIENYKLKFDQSQREKEYYLGFLKKLKEQDEDVDGSDENIDSKLALSSKEYKRLKNEEEQRLEELRLLEDTKDKLEQELKELKAQYQELKNTTLDEVFRLKNEASLQLSSSLNKLKQAKHAYQVHLNHLDKLRKFNIYNAFFAISCDDSNKYGTINNLRLGYKVPWSEVNNALGQVVLLLIFLLKRLNLRLNDYKLVPMGAQSQIIKLSYHSTADGNAPPTTADENAPRTRSKTILNLYSSNEFSLGQLFNFNKLDVSMIALLDIVSHIQSAILQLDSELELPYKISPKKDSIGGKSIRVTSNNEWTESCKFLLTNLNWMLAYTSVHTTSTSV